MLVAHRSRPRLDAAAKSDSFKVDEVPRPIPQPPILAGVDDKLDNITKHITSALAADQFLSRAQPGQLCLESTNAGADLRLLQSPEFSSQAMRAQAKHLLRGRYRNS